jgi:nitrate/TMAO reductase-like tetraheme cytochrome c subunit
MIACAAVGFAAIVGVTGWVVTDVLEQNNDFCNACHLRENVPLHQEIRSDFDDRPALTLAALHAAQPVAARPGDPVARCIDCHGGVSWLGRARVKALAAQDAFFWVIGDFEEPTHMASPLWDEDCRQCHERFDSAEADLGNTPFHALDVHNSALGIDCVECHSVHQAGGNPDVYFLQTAHVRTQCGRCHVEFEEDLQ